MATGNEPEFLHYPLTSQFQVVLSNEPELELPHALEEEIEEIWQEEKSKRFLYNSFLFSLKAFSEQKLVGRFVEYRYYIASRFSCELQEQLKIYPVGVSGLTLCRDQLLIGTRDAKLATYGGYTECVPSGSIEARAYMQGEVDYLAQLMWELQEEAGISEKNLREVTPLGLYFSRQEGIYDIGVALHLDLLEQEMTPDGTAEYPLLDWVSFETWEKKLANPDAKIVPLSRELWKTYLK